MIAFRTRVSDSSELEKGNPVVPGTNPVSAIAAHAGDGKPNWESHGDTGVSRALTDRQSLCDATTDVIVNSREPLMEDARWRTRTVRRRALLAGWL